MRKQEREELRRLEEALMEPEFTEIPADEMDTIESTWQDVSDTHYDIYNTDETDVALDVYSEDVHRGRRSSALPTVLTLIVLVALSAAILWLLKILGVL